MVWKRFRVNVYARIGIIICSILFLKYGMNERPEWLITNIVVGVVIISLVYELLRYVERTNVDLANFLLSVKHNDFTQISSAPATDVAFPELHESFNEIREVYQSLRAEKESHAQYLDTIIEHVQVALICFKPEGDIQLMNKAAKILLDRPYMSHIHILNRVDPKLYSTISSLKSGERKLIKVIINEELLHLAIQATEFKLRNQAYTLLSIQDIRSELDEKEVDTWHKLIRVLTHEIMNSMTPVVSLTQSIQEMLSMEDGYPRPLAEIPEDSARDIRAGIHSIESRGKGLLHFVDIYRNLTRIPNPHFQRIRVQDMFQRLETLMSPIMFQANIDSNFYLASPYLEIMVDQELVEQVLINLIQNSIEALRQSSFSSKHKARITVSALQTDQRKILIQVQDNGPGINEELQDKIFIPFFSTKKEGSGIGLSLSRQIMRLHKGSITYQSAEKGGSIFTLTF